VTTPFIAADLLEILTIAMYEEPLVIYRELAQNAADAIDEGRRCGLLGAGDGEITVTVGRNDRTVTVRDDGPGIPNAVFAERMSAIGNSAKRDGDYRGFRGIGRLAGLGYCQRLVFTSRAAGEPYVNEAAWDGAIVRELFLHGKGIALDDGIRQALKLTRRPVEETDAPHFFEVRLEKVIRLSDDRLACAYPIGQHLSQNAPLEYHPAFTYGPAIVEKLTKHGAWFAVRLTVNGEPVYRPYTDEIGLSEPPRDYKLHRASYVPPAPRTTTINEIEWVTVPAYDRDYPGAIGWVAHHDYPGAIPTACPARGLRLRDGNVAIGDDGVLRRVFPEDRFNSWTIGEIHVLDRRLRPNARRDGLEESMSTSNLIGHLRQVGARIAERCHAASKARKEARDLNTLEARVGALSSMDERDSSPLLLALRPTITAHTVSRIEKLATSEGSQSQRAVGIAAQLAALPEATQPALSNFARGQISLLRRLYASKRADLANALLPYLHDEADAT
jgi:Histidine kinase-, DNA gyrase B-, and HSP90-like ATPase